MCIYSDSRKEQFDQTPEVSNYSLSHYLVQNTIYSGKIYLNYVEIYPNYNICQNEKLYPAD